MPCNAIATASATLAVTTTKVLTKDDLARVIAAVLEVNVIGIQRNAGFAKIKTSRGLITLRGNRISSYALTADEIDRLRAALETAANARLAQAAQDILQRYGLASRLTTAGEAAVLTLEA